MNSGEIESKGAFEGGEISEVRFLDAWDLSLSIIAVFSAVMLTYRWLSIYGITDLVVNFYAGLLIATLVLLIIKKR